MKNNPEVVDVHIYFPAKLHAKLKRRAKQESRTVSAEVVRAVQGHLEAMGRWVRDPRVPKGSGWMDK